MQVMSKLNHPNIIKLIGAVVELPHLCLILEYARLGNLRDYLIKNRTSEWKTYKHAVAIAISKGMSYLHSRNPPIIHLDLKTTNTLISELTEVKLSDFGTARYSTDNNVSTTGAIGSQYYISPEIIRQERFTTATDVYR